MVQLGSLLLVIHSVDPFFGSNANSHALLGAALSLAALGVLFAAVRESTVSDFALTPAAAAVGSVVVLAVVVLGLLP